MQITIGHRRCRRRRRRRRQRRRTTPEWTAPTQSSCRLAGSCVVMTTGRRSGNVALLYRRRIRRYRGIAVAAEKIARLTAAAVASLLHAVLNKSITGSAAACTIRALAEGRRGYELTGMGTRDVGDSCDSCCRHAGLLSFGVEKLFVFVSCGDGAMQLHHNRTLDLICLHAPARDHPRIADRFRPCRWQQAVDTRVDHSCCGFRHVRRPILRPISGENGDYRARQIAACRQQCARHNATCVAVDNPRSAATRLMLLGV